MSSVDVLMVRENAAACLGRVSTGQTVNGQIYQLAVVVAAASVWLRMEPAPENIVQVFEALQEGLDHLLALVERPQELRS